MACTAIAVRAGIEDAAGNRAAGPHTSSEVVQALSARPESYLGMYAPRVPGSYAGVSSFTQVTGVTPSVVMYYSSWLEQFRTGFALDVARHGAVPLVQMEPAGVNLAAIAVGEYDTYLSSFAQAVRSYGDSVIVSFGHEMNGSWYSWGDRHTSAADFVKAWRHIVSVFRTVGADNVTWLWTVNIVSDQQGSTSIPSPAAWWPGSPYVTWVGIDGYYLEPSWRFVSLFGPTIGIVRNFTTKPIIISETGAAQAGQPAQIADLAAEIRAYGLLGFVWFDAVGKSDWRISTPTAVSALRMAARPYARQGA
jgi:hypothetical protein